MLQTPGVKLYVVEGLYGDHQPECAPEPGQDYSYMSVQLGSEIWLKENMLNVGVRSMFPKDWKYMCFSDCDVYFRDKYWVSGALNALQTYNVIQPWSHGIALDKNGGVSSVDTSFGYLAATKQKMSWGRHQQKDGYGYAHSGYAWCCTRFFWENCGGLIDFCLIGSADHHMAWCCVGRADDTIHGSMSRGYFEMVYEWQRRANYACGGRVGYVHGTLEHGFHGYPSGRNYTGRWQILLPPIAYNPKTDIAYDSQGIIYLTGSNANALEGALISYNRTRDEDAI